MQQSGRKTPCPACGRVKDSDCRWTDDVILCHTGSDLRPSGTITIDGAEWYLSRHNGGFDGGAAVFKPHKGEFKPTGANHEQLLNHRAKRAIAALALDRFFTAFDEAWAVRDLHSLAPSELTIGIAAIERAAQFSSELTKSVQQIWRTHPDLKELHRERFNACVKSIGYQVADLQHFRSFYLGEAG